MQLHVIQTSISLLLFLAGFFMIGAGVSMRSDRLRGLISLLGFILVIINLIFLGNVVLSQALVGKN